MASRVGVGAFKFCRVERERLAEFLADLRHDVVGHAIARLRAELLHLSGRERELLPFRFGQRTSQFFFLCGDGLFLRGFGAGGFGVVGVSNGFRKSSR